MSFGECYTYSVEKKLLVVTSRICVLGADMIFLFSVASESCDFIWRRSDFCERCAKCKKCTYFVCNMENCFFQVLSSTVSIQAMQKLTGGQEAMKIRPQGTVPRKHFK